MISTEYSHFFLQNHQFEITFLFFEAWDEVTNSSVSFIAWDGLIEVTM